MADWPMMGDGQTTSALGSTKAVVNGTSVVSPATVNTKTVNWSVIAGQTAAPSTKTPFDAVGIYLANEINTLGTRIMADLGIAVFGSATETEVVLIPNIYYNFSKVSMSGYEVYFPISIPKGSRISIKTQSTTASTANNFSIRLQGAGGNPSSPRSIVQTLGAQTSGLTQGQGLLVGAANAYGSWTVLSTDGVAKGFVYPVEEIILSIQGFNVSYPATTTRIWMDIGIGPDSANVTPLLQKIPMVAHANPDQFMTPFLGPIPCHIPANTSGNAFVWARYQISSLETSPVLPELVLYGVS